MGRGGGARERTAPLRTRDVPREVPMGWLDASFDPLLALLVFALAASEPPRSSHVSPTPFSLSNLLGRASYALYILHKPIYLWMARESGLGRRVPGTAFVLTYVGASLLLSILLWRTVEEPARRWLQGRSRASPVRAAS
jgi:peptidoglycan/LPS O-acetylase OafA/YrhL